MCQSSSCSEIIQELGHLLIDNRKNANNFGEYIWIVAFLTHWGRATHIYVSKLTIIASDNGLSPGRRQAIIWNNDGILWIGLLGTKFSEISIEILTFSFKKMRLKVSSAKWRPFCLGLNVLKKVLCLLLVWRQGICRHKVDKILRD